MSGDQQRLNIKGLGKSVYSHKGHEDNTEGKYDNTVLVARWVFFKWSVRKKDCN